MNDDVGCPPVKEKTTEPYHSITFSFDGHAISAMPGQSIGAALYAAGNRVFSRSFKYHRPRGLFCVSGDCPNCLMQVDGKPNVRTCVEPACEGQVVRHQNAWPALDFDILRTFDRLDRFLPVGFYYKRFHKPRWIWPLFEKVVRRIAGLGRIDVNARPPADAEFEYLHTQVCIVGGGPAGLSAAAAAANAGAKVLLLDRHSVLGGHLLFEKGLGQEGETLRKSVTNHPNVRVLANTSAFGIYEGNVLGAFAPERYFKIRAREIIVCTGGRERPFVFHNNDLPGIFLARGVKRLYRLHKVVAGKRAVVITDYEDGVGVAEDLATLGIEIAAVVSTRSESKKSRKPSTGVFLPSAVIVAARGNKNLESVRIGRRKSDGVDPHSLQDIPCDLLCIASEPVPANELLLQAGYRFGRQEGRWYITRKIPGVAAAGGAAGIFDLVGQQRQGRLEGAEAAARLDLAVNDLENVRKEWSSFRAGPTAYSSVLAAVREKDHKRFVCLCEDVTEKDLYQAVAEGFDGIETLKRYSTASMGPCQGKMCGLAMSEIFASAAGKKPTLIGTTTSRPPAVPVELAVLAAGKHHPVRRTPMHAWHEEAGAHWLDAGAWRRPESYGDSREEVKTVRNRVGLIDVSTLGKIEVVGPDAGELLDRVYLNKWSDLKIGRIRYGVMCNEDGIVFDDGVGARMGPDRFYLTATTGNADAVVQWLELWKTLWNFEVLVLNRTSALAAMNLAGPRSRGVLAMLTRLDLSREAFPYMTMREAEIAGIPCGVMRIGFVGELGYEIHCPASRAEQLWSSLHDAGRDYGLKPFGVEAQRVLRLEKGHFIVGQDTDALSNPLEAGLEKMVLFDKPEFHGRETLVKLKSLGLRSQLVGFVLKENLDLPAEGSQIVHKGRSVGRVTSIRFSPTLERTIGLAWVPAASSLPGENLFIRWNGRDVPGEVTSLPFYDPEGERMKG